LILHELESSDFNETLKILDSGNFSKIIFKCYRYFGKTGIEVSILGFSLMSLPMEKIKGKNL